MPIRAMVKRWARIELSVSQDTGVRTSAVIGGWSAAGKPAWTGSSKKRPAAYTPAWPL